ncbi:ANL family adenylate-forming protein [Rhodopila sp.]|uniref:ANL family adenylate-forming protein n=1 Tax=Rhodopila sp. TaxID=2480087 RepID=UPI003D09DE32
MPRPDHRSLWDLTAAAGLSPRRFLADHRGQVGLASLDQASLDQAGTFDRPLHRFQGQSVLIWSDRQMIFALAVLQLDGIAARVVLCPPDLSPAHLPDVLQQARVDVIVCDAAPPIATAIPIVPCAIVPCAIVPCAPQPAQTPHHHDRGTRTEWLLFTSGTTGRPKLVVHNLASLTGPLDDRLAVAQDTVWATFYDVRRYGGLQILLRALLGGGSMVLSHHQEPVAAFLTRAGQCGVTHISGTPSHWRRALMTNAHRISPRYVRLSGEVADQPILNQLSTAYPGATISHAFASTEAGVAFDVSDGLAGFPATLIGQPGAKADLRVEHGSLRIRSARTASRYLGDQVTLADVDGFVDTGDIVALRGDRYYFAGRREGVINVGGQKVHPEEVEAVISQHPAVQIARVRGRPSPITGTLVVADIVLRPQAAQHCFKTISAEILTSCKAALPAHKVPAMLRPVAGLDIAASGKLARTDA